MKVTIYRTGELFGNIIAHEGELISVERCKYAQYRNAIKLTVRYKRKRRAVTHYITYQPYIVIVEGWNKPAAPDMYDKIAEHENGLIVSSSSFKSFDPRLCTNFDQLVDSGKLGNIVFDVRHTKNQTCY